MTCTRSTDLSSSAGHVVWRAGPGGARSGRRMAAAAIAVAGAALLSGCISVNAPDKPIVIELNINIKQEVIYRLAEDVKQNIEANPDIF